MKELPPEGKLELSRRMNVYSAVSNGLGQNVYELVQCEKWLKEYKASKSPIWMGGVFFLFLFLGSVWSVFYSFAAGLAAIYIFRVWGADKYDRDRTTLIRRIEELRGIWIAGGLRSSDFDSLVSLARRDYGSGLCNLDEEYQNWWKQLKSNAEGDIRDALGLEGTV